MEMSGAQTGALWAFCFLGPSVLPLGECQGGNPNTDVLKSRGTRIKALDLDSLGFKGLAHPSLLRVQGLGLKISLDIVSGGELHILVLPFWPIPNLFSKGPDSGDHAQSSDNRRLSLIKCPHELP